MINIKELYEKIKDLNFYHKSIMYILLDIFEDECSCNEGSIRECDLIKIYNLMLDYERNKKIRKEN